MPSIVFGLSGCYLCDATCCRISMTYPCGWIWSVMHVCCLWFVVVPYLTCGCYLCHVYLKVVIYLVLHCRHIVYLVLLSIYGYVAMLVSCIVCCLWLVCLVCVIYVMLNVILLQLHIFVLRFYSKLIFFFFLTLNWYSKYFFNPLNSKYTKASHFKVQLICKLLFSIEKVFTTYTHHWCVFDMYLVTMAYTYVIILIHFILFS